MNWYSLHWFSPAQWQQFRFAHPLALYAVALVPLLFVLRHYLHRRAKQQLNLSIERDLQATVERPVTNAQWWVSQLRWGLPLGVGTGVALLLTALARPQIVRTLREEQSLGIDIMLAMDVSSSMTETDLPPNRLAAARRVAQAFVKGRRNDRIGLVIFAGEAFSLCPLTTDHPLINQYLTDLSDQMIRTSGTAIGDALARCINRLRESNLVRSDTTQRAAASTPPARSKVIILLSDGDNTAGNLDPLTAARLASAFSIRLYTIAVGRPARANPTAQTVDEGVLKTVAAIGHGSFFRATDAGRLRAVFAQINRLERAPVRVRVYEDVQDYYYVYLNWGVGFLLLALALKCTIVGNVLED